MPLTAKIFMVGMVASIIHLVIAGHVPSGAVSIAQAETAAINLEAVRRVGVAVYLVAIAFGLGTITRVLRFQAIRIRELAS